jgi:hypothetical protein
MKMLPLKKRFAYYSTPQLEKLLVACKKRKKLYEETPEDDFCPFCIAAPDCSQCAWVLFTCRSCTGNGAHAVIFGMEDYETKQQLNYKCQSIKRRIARLANWTTKLEKELARRAASAS